MRFGTSVLRVAWLCVGASLLACSGPQPVGAAATLDAATPGDVLDATDGAQELPAPDAAANDAIAQDVTTLPDGDAIAPDTTPAKDVCDPGDAAPAADGQCTKTHKRNDGKQPQDNCWQPPQNVCSGAAAQAETKACAPCAKFCCQFMDYCIPCGWTNCNENKNASECSNPVLPLTAPECASFKPNKQPYCWDGG